MPKKRRARKSEKWDCLIFPCSSLIIPLAT